MAFSFARERRSCQELQRALQSPGWHLALLPVGCYEQHGPELPLDTDLLEAEELTQRLALRLNQKSGIQTYCLPSLAYTPSEPNKDFSGTVSVSCDAFRAYFESLVRGILRTEYSGVIIVNAHGSVGPILDEMTFKLVMEQFDAGKHPIRPILSVNTYDVWSKVEAEFGQKPGLHADWCELLMTFAVLGESYYGLEKLERLKQFSREHDFDQTFPRVLGIPAHLRSVQGVQGQPWPGEPSDFADLAGRYWEFVESEVLALVLSELERFEQEFSQARLS